MTCETWFPTEVSEIVLNCVRICQTRPTNTVVFVFRGVLSLYPDTFPFVNNAFSIKIPIFKNEEKKSQMNRWHAGFCTVLEV